MPHLALQCAYKIRACEPTTIAFSFACPNVRCSSLVGLLRPLISTRYCHSAAGSLHWTSLADSSLVSAVPNGPSIANPEAHSHNAHKQHTAQCTRHSRMHNAHKQHNAQCTQSQSLHTPLDTQRRIPICSTTRLSPAAHTQQRAVPERPKAHKYIHMCTHLKGPKPREKISPMISCT